MNPARRVSHAWLCLAPWAVIAAASVRPLRGTGIHDAVGLVLGGALLVAAWYLGARVVVRSANAQRMAGVAGLLLVLPFALMGLFWVGLGTPWQATAAENVMRYSILLVGTISVTIAFVAATEALREAAERFWSMLGFALSLLAGAAYVVWTSFQLGAWVVRVQPAPAPEVLGSIAAMDAVNDVLLFAACALTYAAAAAFALAFSAVHWLGRTASRSCVGIAVVALALLVLRGLAFPNPTAAGAWYMQPGFVAGIPAVPWLIPYFLGVVVLRRAGTVEGALESASAARTEGAT